MIFMLGSFDIVRRHDKNDSEYLALGAKFSSVCKVGKRGGDGTLIAPRWVITAAHVGQGMFEREGQNLQIYFEGNPKGIKVEKVFIHPDFKPMRGADIALLYLEEEVKSITPAKLYDRRDEPGNEITIVGHGDTRTGQGGEWISDGQRRAATNLIDEVNSDKIIFNFDEPGLGTELEGTAGPGDSGGPAFIIIDGKPYMAGISSAGMPGTSGPGTYGAKEFYTRVSSYLDWINKTILNPDDQKTLMNTQAVEGSSGSRVVTNRPQGGPLPGLGLFLRQEGDKIRIGGKADPKVPKAFRQVMFKPPSFLVAFNGANYTSLDSFMKDFGALKTGAEFSITFEIQGKVLEFQAQKM